VLPPAPILKVAVRNITEGKSVALYIVDAPQDGPTLSSFLPGFKKSWFKEGVSSNRSEEWTTIDGRSACRLNDTVTTQGMVMQRVDIIVIDNKLVYQVAAMSRSGDPVEDPEISATLKSFHFLSDAASNSAKVSMSHPVDRLPRLIGSITFYVLVGIAAIALITKTWPRQKTKS
jgi:hypothetical protein